MAGQMSRTQPALIGAPFLTASFKQFVISFAVPEIVETFSPSKGAIVRRAAVAPKQRPALRSNMRISRTTVDTPERSQQLKLADRGIVSTLVSV